MNNITYEYIDYTNEKFKEVIELRFNILFKPYGKINKYDYDEIDKNSFHLVVLHTNKVIAYSRMTDIDNTGKITNVAVNPEYIKRGIGVEMLRTQIKKAQENKIKELYLSARLDTVNFYKKVGFQCQGDTFISEKSGLMLQEMHYLL